MSLTRILVNDTFLINLINKAREQRSEDSSNSPSPESFVEHFNLLGNVQQDELLSGEVENDILDNTELNKSITKEEVNKCILKLKNNKSSGSDLILNECIKHAAPKLLEPISQLFEIVLKCGKIPESWAIGVICPIYKGNRLSTKC